ncbi:MULTISPECIES: TlpA family protein disulfide reductase [Winogradskyella]|uniref:TlpA family protein disulfide reductase n=1 Tax=Winogradskyella TaxID=286104 RepID=UPI0015C6ED5B|nr:MULTISPECIES: TlpA disulfide reductase family protein [Winogradskyella]QNK77454.1 TlpA family protein disulfide reductase [Winogradskyella sp. PAMC22761]QXP79981.1 TlpA family protein disulfide reductase [Winogradskyella sp. HaHa_3_26]
MNRIIYIFFLGIFSLTASAQNELPNLDLKSIDGKTVTLKETLNDDGVTIISLWATWCVPCLKELDAINDIYDEWQEETNVKLIAVSVDDSRTVKRVKSLVNGKGWEYTVLLDTNTELKRALNASSIPLTILVKDNKIVYKHSGYSPGAELELYEKIKELSK